MSFYVSVGYYTLRIYAQLHVRNFYIVYFNIS